MTQKTKIAAIVRALFNEKIGGVEITGVTVEPGIDDDGEEFLRIAVIYTGREKLLDASKTSTLARHLIPKLQEKGEHRFPVLSFIPESELKHEAA